MKRVLMIAYHFLPLAGSSGIQRGLRFARHLPESGWEPLVLSADPRAYERTSDDLLADIPPGVVVRRAFALDTARHLSIGGRYIAALARPDRWLSWKFAAVRQGLRMIREFRPQAIWSTYPIATAHLIGAELQRRSGLPWLADFRDPMAQEDYPPDPLTRRHFLEIEEKALRAARFCTFTTGFAGGGARRQGGLADRPGGGRCLARRADAPTGSPARRGDGMLKMAATPLAATRRKVAAKASPCAFEAPPPRGERGASDLPAKGLQGARGMYCRRFSSPPAGRGRTC